MGPDPPGCGHRRRALPSTPHAYLLRLTRRGGHGCPGTQGGRRRLKARGPRAPQAGTDSERSEPKPTGTPEPATGFGVSATPLTAVGGAGEATLTCVETPRRWACATVDWRRSRTKRKAQNAETDLTSAPGSRFRPVTRSACAQEERGWKTGPRETASGTVRGESEAVPDAHCLGGAWVERFWLGSARALRSGLAAVHGTGWGALRERFR